MALIQRLSKLVTADIHSVLDLIEDPYSLLKQAVRDMEANVELQKQNLEVKKKAKNLQLSFQDNLQKQLESLTKELDLCFKSKNADLARSLVKRKLANEKRTLQHSRNCEALEKNILELSQQLHENRSKLETMQQELKMYDQQRSQDSLTVHDSNLAVSEEEIDIAILAEKQARSQS